MRERGVELRKEVLIPDSITAPYEMKPPMWFKPSLPNQEPHPYVEYGVSWKDGQPIRAGAYFVCFSSIRRTTLKISEKNDFFC